MTESSRPRPDDGVQVLEQSWSRETAVIVSTLRALLKADSRGQAAALLQAAIGDLGGEVVLAREAEGADLPVDVSLGVGEPLVVRLPDDESSAQFLSAHVASIVEDAMWAARRSDRHQRETVRASTQTSTKVESLAEIGSHVALSVPGDAVCVLELGDDTPGDEERGPRAADLARRDFGALLLASIREDDVVGSTGEGQFVVVLREAPADVAGRRMRFMVNKWLVSGRHATSVAVGVALVDARGGALALRAADLAMDRARGSDRSLVELAGPDDYIDA